MVGFTEGSRVLCACFSNTFPAENERFEVAERDDIVMRGDVMRGDVM